MKIKAPILQFIKSNSEQLFKNIVQVAKKYKGNELVNKLNVVINYYFNLGKEDMFQDIMLPDLRKEVKKLSEELHDGLKEEEIEFQDIKENEKIKKKEKLGLFKHGSYDWLGNYRSDDMKAWLKNKYKDELDEIKHDRLALNKMDQDLKDLMLDTFHSCYLLDTEAKRTFKPNESRFIRPLTDNNSIRDNTVADELLSKRIASNLFSRMLKVLDEEAELQDQLNEIQNKQKENKEKQDQLKEEKKELEEQKKEMEQKQKELEEQKDNAQSQKEKNQIQKELDKNQQQQQQNEQQQQQNQQQQDQTKKDQKDLKNKEQQASDELEDQQKEGNEDFQTACAQASKDAKDGKQVKALLSMSGGKDAGDQSMINEIREDFLDKNMLNRINIDKFSQIIKSTKFLDIEMKDYKNDVFGTTSGVTIGDDLKEILTDELISDDWEFYLNYIESNLLQSEMKASTIPSDYIVLIDSSGSMGDHNKVTVSRAIAYWFMLKTIKEKGNAYLWFFNASPVGREPISFKKDKKGFLTALFGTMPDGGTCITSILRETKRFIDRTEDYQLKKNKEVILISDHESSIDEHVLKNKNFNLHVIAVGGGRGSALDTLKNYTKDKKVFMLDEANKLLKAFKE